MKIRTILALSFCIVGTFILSVRAQDFYDETVLRTLQLEFSQADWWSQLEANYATDENILATLIVDEQVYADVGVRFRGNTSYQRVNSEKKPFNIEIDYTYEDQRLMGYKTLNLINCNGDPTFMREVLYSNTCRRQIPSAKANFVILEINGENWGVYANVQQLNRKFIEDWFPSNNGTRWRAQGTMDGGGGDNPGPPPGGDDENPGPPAGGGRPPVGNEIPNAGDGGGVTNGVAALTWQGSDTTVYEVVYELKNTNQDDPWIPLIQTCDVLNNTSLEELPDVLDTVLNVDRALWMCAFEIIFSDDDGYVNKRGSDYCLYYEPETGRLHLMQYDGNECMSQEAWSLFYREEDAVVPLMSRLMAVDAYRQRYLAHARTILASFLTEESLFGTIDAYHSLIEAEVEADDKKLYSNQAFVSGIEELKEFVRNRRISLLTNREVNVPIPDIIAVSQKVKQNGTQQSLTITASLGDTVPVADVHLYISAGFSERFIPVPMVDDGRHGDGQALDGIFGYMLPSYPAGTVLRYYVQATADDSVGTLVFSPEGAEHNNYTHVVTYAQADSSPVVINEVMAKNDAAWADPQDEYDDWIELKNASDEAIDLAGMYLSDNPEIPLKWQFPADMVIEAGDYLIVWADEDGGDEPGLHANFKLASAGETIWLYDTDERGNALLDSVSFEALEADQSIGRSPDGIGFFQVLSTPSPANPNDG